MFSVCVCVCVRERERVFHSSVCGEEGGGVLCLVSLLMRPSETPVCYRGCSGVDELSAKTQPVVKLVVGRCAYQNSLYEAAAAFP